MLERALDVLEAEGRSPRTWTCPTLKSHAEPRGCPPGAPWAWAGSKKPQDQHWLGWAIPGVPRAGGLTAVTSSLPALEE